MEKLTAKVIESSFSGCDDIGVLFYINYNCPYCGENVVIHGLMSYDDYYNTDNPLTGYCKKCEKSCILDFKEEA